MVRPSSDRKVIGRVPALLLETVVTVEQDLKNLKVVDIAKEQTTRSFTDCRTEGMEASVRIFGVKSACDQWPGMLDEARGVESRPWHFSSGCR